MAAKSKETPIILVTNDDGITAPGILSLVEAVKDLGKVTVVAPDKPQSGMGHAITIGYHTAFCALFFTVNWTWSHTIVA